MAITWSSSGRGCCPTDHSSSPRGSNGAPLGRPRPYTTRGVGNRLRAGQFDETSFACRRNTPVKILVVDDHPLIREAMRTVLKQLDSSMQVLEAGNCDDALEIAGGEPDLSLVLLDLRMPGTSGLDGLATLRERHP